MQPRHARRFVLVFALSGAIALAVGVGRVQGFVRDATGKPIAGAKVTFKHVAQGFERTVTCDETGKYLISTLPFGPIAITVSADGFAPFSEDFNWIPDANPATRDFKLAAAGAAGGPAPKVQVIEGLTPELAKALDDANEANAAEDFAKAASIYEGARASSNDHPLVLMGLVTSYMRLKQDAKAEEVLKVALTKSPVPAGAHFYMGSILAAKGQKDKAIEEFRAETTVSPANDRAFYNLGAMLYDLGKKDDALAALEKAKSINPGNADAAGLLASLYSEKGDSGKAAEAAKSAGSDPTALMNTGVKFFNDHKDKEALDAFQKVVEANPKNAKAQKLLGLTYVRVGQLNEAKAALKIAAELDPKDAETKQMLKDLGE
ncbi:MAG: tetratricopeptide repeat protein [Acidobacteriota bacterium]